MRAAGLVLLGAISVASAASAQPIPWELRETSDDIVGQRLAFQIREVLTESRQFVAASTGKRVELRMVTLDSDDPPKGYQTLYSVAFNFLVPDEPAPYFMTLYVGTCGRERLRSCAEGVAALAVRQYESRVRAPAK